MLLQMADALAFCGPCSGAPLQQISSVRILLVSVAQLADEVCLDPVYVPLLMTLTVQSLPLKKKKIHYTVLVLKETSFENVVATL